MFYGQRSGACKLIAQNYDTEYESERVLEKDNGVSCVFSQAVGFQFRSGLPVIGHSRT